MCLCCLYLVYHSAWAQQAGCGSIFSPQILDADLAVPNAVALDLSEIQASMQQPLQQHPLLLPANDCNNYSSMGPSTAAMARPELLLHWDAVMPVPLLPAAGQPWDAVLQGSTCTSASAQQRCVPDMPGQSLSSSTSSSDQACGPRPAADALPPGKRVKLQPQPQQQQQQQQQSVSAQLAEDTQCAVVPDVPAAAAAVPSSSCCSSDSSSGHAADAQDSAAAHVAFAASVSGGQAPTGFVQGEESTV
jgi:hypothetical protein